MLWPVIFIRFNISWSFERSAHFFFIRHTYTFLIACNNYLFNWPTSLCFLHFLHSFSTFFVTIAQILLIIWLLIIYIDHFYNITPIHWITCNFWKKSYRLSYFVCCITYYIFFLWQEIWFILHSIFRSLCSSSCKKVYRSVFHLIQNIIDW